MSKTSEAMEVEKPATTTAAVTVNPMAVLGNDLAYNARLIAKSTTTKEARFAVRAVRQSTLLRRRLLTNSVAPLIALLPPSSPFLPLLIPFDSSAQQQQPPQQQQSQSQLTVESQAYLELLAALYITSKQQEQEKVRDLLVEMSRRSLKFDVSQDALVARIWQARGIAQLDSPQLTVSSSSSVAIRAELLAAHRQTSARRMDESRATLLNLLLKYHVDRSLFSQARKLASKCSVQPTSSSTGAPTASSSSAVVGSVSNGQMARYHYYMGKIRASELDYGAAAEHLQQALHKAPQAAEKGQGFKLAVSKMLCVVQLLVGEVPERSTLASKRLRAYLKLTQAVRVGDIDAFTRVVGENSGQLARDGTLALVHRLRHNVIKAALRKICISYSRISLADIAAKVGMSPSSKEELSDCEFIVAKAIRDGVIDAVIDHDNQFVQSKENVDLYATREPQAAVRRRVAFCLGLYNDSRRSMRYPPDAHKPRPLQDLDEDSKRAAEEAAYNAEEDEGGDDF